VGALAILGDCRGRFIEEERDTVPRANQGANGRLAAAVRRKFRVFWSSGGCSGMAMSPG
jgi:hypothetical protein